MKVLSVSREKSSARSIFRSARFLVENLLPCLSPTMIVFYLVSNASKRTVFGFALSRTHRACTWGLAPASAYFFRARSAKNRCRNTLALPSTCSNFFLLVFSSLLFLALIPCCRDVVTRFPFTLFFCFLSLPRCRFLDGRAFPATPVFLLAHFFFSFPLRVSLGLTPIWSLATSEGVKTIIIKKKDQKKRIKLLRSSHHPLPRMRWRLVALE